MRLGLRLNTQLLAPTQLSLPFNSMAYNKEYVMGGSDEGLFIVRGNEDWVDGTQESILEPVPINALISLVTTDFGTARYKRIRWIYVGYKSKGDLSLLVSPDDDDSEEYVLPAINEEYKQTGNKIPISRDQVGRYFTLSIMNPGGVSFSIDNISAAISLLPHAPRG